MGSGGSRILRKSLSREFESIDGHDSLGLTLLSLTPNRGAVPTTSPNVIVIGGVYRSVDERPGAVANVGTYWFLFRGAHAVKTGAGERKEA